MQQLPLDLFQAPAPTLDNFVVGPNAEALAVFRQVDAGKPPSRIVFLSGPAGSGKSHLLSALAARDGSRNLSALLAEPNHARLRAEDDNATVWVADNIDHLDPERQQTLFNLVNQLRGRPGSCLLASARNGPGGLVLRDDLRTRLAAGLSLTLTPLADHEKLEALRRAANDRGLTAPDAVLNWLLTRQSRDMRHLVAYLDAIDRYALQSRRSLTVPLLREFERSHREQPPADTLDG